MNFGIAKSVKSREVQVCTPDLLDRYLDSPSVARICAEIADAREKKLEGVLTSDEFETIKQQMKQRLPILTPHATFKNGQRRNAEAVSSGLSMYDIDHIQNPRGRWEQMAPRAEELGIVLAHITPSCEGLRLLFVVPEGMDLPQAQQWMAGQLGDAQYDAVCKDLARCSFLVPREYVLYLDSVRLFGDADERGRNHESSQIKQINTDNQESNKESVLNPCESVVENEESDDCPQTYKGIPYADIVRELENQLGGKPERGERNNFLFKIACHLRYILNNRADWLMRYLPTYGEEPEKWKSAIQSAVNQIRKRDMTDALSRAVKVCQQRRGDTPTDEADETPDLPPAMPKKLPPLIDLLVSKTPDIYKAAVAHAVFPSLAAHLWKTRFRYVDNVEHEATLMNVLMAGTGAGKSCITQPINYIMADIRARDEENLRREKAWKDEVNAKGSNKDKRKRPEGLVIQEVDPDMTNPAFVLRLSEADGHFLYAHMNELDQFDALRGGGRGKQQFQIMCLSFDPDNRYGQTRVGTQSITEKVQIRFNWNASTTIAKGQRYFSQVLTDGPLSRINFCTIPEREIGAPMPVYGTYDEAFAEALRPYIERLNKARGLVECPGAERLAKKLIEECADFSRLSQDRVYENLSFRAVCIAYLKACVLTVANDGKWDKTMEEFIRWSLEYDLWCKIHFFHEGIVNADSEMWQTKRRGPKNLLDYLPETFTMEDATRLRLKMGKSERGTYHMVKMWKSRGFVSQLTINSYKKEVCNR